MSMNSYGQSGYIVTAEAFAAAIPFALRESYLGAVDASLKECDSCPLEEWIEANYPRDGVLPYPESVYYPKEEDTSGQGMQLDDCGIYIVFIEEDLYVKTPNEAMLKLQELGVEPKFSEWATWA